MKKSLLALAVLGAFAGAAQAQTSVTIYGIVDAGIQYDNGSANKAGTTTAGRKWSLDSGLQSGSRVGFKGTEDLGGGLNAQFQLENGFNVDNGGFNGGTGGNNRLFGRMAWVGLGSQSVGAVKLGRQLTPLYNSVAVVDPFGIGLSGNMLKFFGAGTYNQGLDRTDNTVKYETPVFAGFSASVAYGFGEQAGNFATGRSFGAGLGYANGPINIQADWQDNRNAGSANSNTNLTGASALTGTVPGFFGFTGQGNTTSATTGVTTATPAPDLRTAFIGGYYDLNVVKIHAAFADTKATANAAGTGFGIGAVSKDRNYMVGVSAPIGAGTVMASWQRNDFRDISSGASNLFAVGYTYSLSKRTNLYTSAGYTRNDSGAAMNVPVANVGQSDRVFNVGVRHLF